MEVFEVGGLRVLERVGFEEGGLVWDETVRVVVEEEGVGGGMEVEEEDVVEEEEEEEAAGRWCCGVRGL